MKQLVADFQRLTKNRLKKFVFPLALIQKLDQSLFVMSNQAKQNKPRVTTFLATYTGQGSENGKKFRWAFWKDGKYWFLRDCDGYVRTLELTWRHSVPVIRLILENYGMEAEIS